MVLSVLPSRTLAMSAHLFAWSLFRRKRIHSSSRVHWELLFIIGFKWLCHLSRHCFPILPGRWLATWVHFWGPSMLTSCNRSLSSISVQGPLTRFGFRTFYHLCKHCTSVLPSIVSAIFFQFFPLLTFTASASFLSSTSVQCPLTLAFALKPAVFVFWYFVGPRLYKWGFCIWCRIKFCCVSPNGMLLSVFAMLLWYWQVPWCLAASPCRVSWSISTKLLEFSSWRCSIFWAWMLVNSDGDLLRVSLGAFYWVLRITFNVFAVSYYVMVKLSILIYWIYIKTVSPFIFYVSLALYWFCTLRFSLAAVSFVILFFDLFGALFFLLADVWFPWSCCWSHSSKSLPPVDWPDLVNSLYFLALFCWPL